MTRNINVTAPIKVWKFRKYDMTTDEYVESSRYGSEEAITRISAERIEETEVIIDSGLLDSNGMTEKGFSPSKSR